MTNQVALLRGINVGGRHKVPMARLRELATMLGWQDVRTYINSGNLWFTSQELAGECAARLRSALQEEFGFDVPVLVVSVEALRQFVEECPFPDADPKRVTISICSSEPSPEAVRRLTESAAPAERVVVRGPVIHVDFADGLAGSKLAAKMGSLVGDGIHVTTRNLATMRVLAAN